MMCVCTFYILHASLLICMRMICSRLFMLFNGYGWMKSSMLDGWKKSVDVCAERRICFFFFILVSLFLSVVSGNSSIFNWNWSTCSTHQQSHNQQQQSYKQRQRHLILDSLFIFLISLWTLFGASLFSSSFLHLFKFYGVVKQTLFRIGCPICFFFFFHWFALRECRLMKQKEFDYYCYLGGTKYVHVWLSYGNELWI